MNLNSLRSEKKIQLKKKKKKRSDKKNNILLPGGRFTDINNNKLKIYGILR